MKTSVCPTSVLAASAGACLGLAAVSASAQCSVYRFGMPDFDQRRSGLLNEGGSYCVPTATASALAYISNHGYPDVLGGPRDWQSQTHYDEITGVLASLGVLMFTDPDRGTTMPLWQAATRSVLSDEPFFLVGTYEVGGFQGLNPVQMADQMRLGAIVLPRIGWYEEFTPGSNLFARNGGHMVMMSAGLGTCGDPTDMLLGYRDPSSGDSIFSQSEFRSTFTNFSRSGAWRFRYASETIFLPRPLYRLNTNGGFLDGMGIILPSHGLTTDPGTQDISLFSPQGTTDEPGPKIFDLRTWPDTTQLLAVGQDVLPTEGFILTLPDAARVGTLSKVHFLDGVAEDIAFITSPIDLAVGRDGSAYVAAGTSIQRYELDDDGEFALTDEVALPAGPSSMLYDDATDQLLVLSATGRRLFQLDQDLNVLRNDTVPAAVPLIGESSISVNPVDGSEWIASTGSPTLTRFVRDDVGRPSIESQTTLPGVDEPTALQFDDYGFLYVVDDGIVRSFEFSPRAGWFEADTPLDGTPSGPIFRIGRGRSNNTPEADDFDRLPPVPIEGELECLADLDLDGELTIFDFLEFQNLFSSGSTWADFDFDGQLTLFDFLAFQNAFDAGCP
ncbi:MAG: GC-type dockerin domain-anchored protein [Planctomycetota bacterium]